MAMSAGGDKQGVMLDINMTPLIDVMLVLIVTLIMSLPIQTHAVKLDMPQDTNVPPPETLPEVIQLDIDFDGGVYWNGNQVDSLTKLDGYFKLESRKDPQAEIHLQPDKRARYDIVAKVLASAQRNHMYKIGFVNTMAFAAD
jgi:biopolymer transport protein ExbD